jgi:hypothetical protein
MLSWPIFRTAHVQLEHHFKHWRDSFTPQRPQLCLDHHGKIDQA